ncbi:MAG: hypothetical protein ACW99U_06400 [Candidatus Thorarchaeota archaeon]
MRSRRSKTLTEDDVATRITETEMPPAAEDVEESVVDVKAEKYDLQQVLIKTGHLTHVFPNGMLLGVRTNGIPRSRGVHVEVVFVLDLRKAEFGRGTLAMKSSVLEASNRMLEYILRDVGLGDRLDRTSVLTPWGRVSFPVVLSDDGKRRSVLHETRTIYVVTKEVRPVIDLDWLTDPSRVVDFEGFALARRSDQRSLLPEIKKCVDSEKWGSLESGVREGWYGLVASFMATIGALSSLVVLLSGVGTIIMPLLALGGGGGLSGVLLKRSRTSVKKFTSALEEEQSSLMHVGDSDRVREAVMENIGLMKTINDAGFVISPLLTSAACAVESGDIERSMLLCSSILDECVRVSDEFTGESPTAEFVVSGDKGLGRFLDVFRNLGGMADSDEEGDLMDLYTSVTCHHENPVGKERAITLLSVLRNTLYHAGIIQLDTRDSIDDLVVRGSRDGLMAHLDKELAKPMEEIPDPTQEHEDLLRDIEDQSEEEQELVRVAEVEEEMPTAADIVKKRSPLSNRRRGGEAKSA